MNNTKIILGIAAGVAALTVAGIILKRRGHLDGIISKAEELGSDITDKYSNIKEVARKNFEKVVEKGGDIADKIVTHTEKAEAAKTTLSARA